MVVMIAAFHILQETFAIDVLRALKPSLKHDRKHVLRLLRLYGDQDKAWFPFTANYTTTTQTQSDYVVEQSSFTLIALFWLEIGRCRGRNWPYGNQALVLFLKINLFQLNFEYNRQEGTGSQDGQT